MRDRRRAAGVDGVDAPANDAFVFGMALSGFAIKMFNHMYILKHEQLQCKPTTHAVSPVNGPFEKLLGRLHIAPAAKNAGQLCSRLVDALMMVVSSRGIGW